MNQEHHLITKEMQESWEEKNNHPYNNKKNPHNRQ
jgi:hypothetical protein